MISSWNVLLQFFSWISIDFNPFHELIVISWFYLHSNWTVKSKCNLLFEIFINKVIDKIHFKLRFNFELFEYIDLSTLRTLRWVNWVNWVQRIECKELSTLNTHNNVLRIHWIHWIDSINRVHELGKRQKISD